MCAPARPGGASQDDEEPRGRFWKPVTCPVPRRVGGQPCQPAGPAGNRVGGHRAGSRHARGDAVPDRRPLVHPRRGRDPARRTPELPAADPDAGQRGRGAHRVLRADLGGLPAGGQRRTGGQGPLGGGHGGGGGCGDPARAAPGVRPRRAGRGAAVRRVPLGEFLRRGRARVRPRHRPRHGSQLLPRPSPSSRHSAGDRRATSADRAEAP